MDIAKGQPTRKNQAVEVVVDGIAVPHRSDRSLPGGDDVGVRRWNDCPQTEVGQHHPRGRTLACDVVDEVGALVFHGHAEAFEHGEHLGEYDGPRTEEPAAWRCSDREGELGPTPSRYGDDCGELEVGGVHCAWSAANDIPDAWCHDGSVCRS